MALRTKDITLLSAQSLTADFESPPIDVSEWDGYFIQANITSSGDSAGDMSLEVSADGTNFDTYPASTQAVSATDTIKTWEVFDKHHKYVRVDWNNTSGTGSTVTLLAHLESQVPS